MEDALEESLSALLADSAIEGPATGLNAEAHVLMIVLGVEAADYAEALTIGIAHAKRAASAAGFELAGIQRVEVSTASELATAY